MESSGDNKKVNVVRRRLFVKHERDHSGSSHASVTSQEKRSSGVFSFFKWFKKSDEHISGGESKNSSLPASPTLRRNQSVSCGSLLSTATVSSFSFVNPGKYRPHVSLRQIHPGPDTDTYRNRIKQRDHLREMDKDLTLKKKYNLLGSSTMSIYHSVEDLATCSRPVGVTRSSSLGRKKRKAPQPPLLEEGKTARGVYGHRRTVSDCEARRVHVKGKRKAPPPPTPTSSMNNTLSRSWRKKRPAPSLPFNSEEKSRLLHSLEKLKAHAEKQSSACSSPLLGGRESLGNDFLKLESGVLRANKEELPGPSSSGVKDRSVTPSSPVSPRPWYKRNRQPSYSEKFKVKDKENDWLSEGNIQPRKNSMSEKDPIQALVRQSLILTNDTKPSLELNTSDTKPSTSRTKPGTSDTPKRSHSFFSDGLKHSLSSSSCNSNTSYASPSRFSFFSRSSDDSKRRSQVSMLANISALDREAAEIIEREHQRQKALQKLEDAKFYTDEVPPEHEYTEINEEESSEVPEPKRASTRELISLFNAIGNVTRVTVNTAFFTRDSAANLFSRSDKKFNVNCKPSPGNKRREMFKKIENFDQLEEWTESPRARRANQSEQRAKLRLGFGEPYKPNGESEPEEGVTIEELEDERVEKPESSRVPYKYHRSPSPSIPTILELSEHSSASAFSSLASTPLSPQTPSAPTLSNPRPTPQIAQLVWSCPQCTLENLKWKFVCDACNFFRPFSIEMKPKTTLEPPAATNTTIVPSDTGILGNAPASKEEATTAPSEPGFCSQPTASPASRKAPYYMSDVLKSPDKQLSVVERLKALPSTSIMDPEPRPIPAERKMKEASKENVRVEVKQENNKEVEELRKARLAFYDKTNRDVETKTEVQATAATQSAGNSKPSDSSASRESSVDSKPCDTSDLKKLLREMKHSIPQSSNKPLHDYTAPENTDHEIKPFVKFENNRVVQTTKTAVASTSSNVLQSKEISNKSPVVIERKKETADSFKTTNATAQTNAKQTIIVDKNINTVQQNSNLAQVNGTRLNETNPNRNNVLGTKLFKDLVVNGSKVNESLTNGTNPTSPKINGSIANGQIVVNGSAIKKTNHSLAVDEIEFDDNSLDRIKLDDDKKAEVYLIKSKTILEDILVKKPTSKVSISVQTNSSIVRKSEIETRNEQRDAYNVTVPVVHEEYKINPDGTLVTSLSKRNKIIGTGTFQLIRSRDFVGIEAMKTGRPALVNGIGDHTYANIDDESLSTSTCTSSTNCTSQVSPLPDDRTSNLIRSKCFADFKARFVSSNNNVNTVAVNRLLKRLEAAIANGEHHKAASLAKELARLKISCSVTRQSAEEEEVAKSKHILINMYVEDKVSHQGPIPLSVLSTMTVGQLKRKLEIEYEIPVRVQRWILGKSLGTNDGATLEQMGVSENGTPVFLYLVAPEPPRTVEASAHSPILGVPGPSAQPLSPDTHTASTSFGTLNSAESSRASSLERDLSETQLPLHEDYIVEEAEDSSLSELHNVPSTSARFTSPLTSPDLPPTSGFTPIPTSMLTPPASNSPHISSPPNFTPAPTTSSNISPQKPPHPIVTQIPTFSAPNSPHIAPPTPKLAPLPPNTNAVPASTTSRATPEVSPLPSSSKFIPLPSNNATAPSPTPRNLPKLAPSIPTSPPNQTNLPSSSKPAPLLSASSPSRLPSPPSSSSPSPPTLPSTLPLSSTLRVGWRCTVCTLMNSPTRPGCAACDSERPLGYRVPQHYAMSPTELSRLMNEEQIEKDVAAQKVANYNELVQLERADLVVNTEAIECPICLTECTPPNGAVLRECLHSFCKQCLSQTIQYTSDAVVKCPYRDASYACDCALQEREIKALVSVQAYEAHLAKSIALAEAQIQNAFHCKTPDCRGWCIFEDNVNEFRCPVCTLVNCLTCQAIHDGLNCKQYQDHMKADSDTNRDARRSRDMLEEMVERGEAMVCPQCRVVLMKKWGCDWLRCSMCKTEICWVTRGPRWGPNGKGDTSAGCKCGINGVKCHPKCNYCH